MDEKRRLDELQRRNTLCLPHLKSSYPMELAVDKENKAPSESVLKDTHGKRKGEEEVGPRGTYKKWKTENTLSISSDLSYLGRSIRSESNLRRDAAVSSQFSQPSGIESKPSAQPQSCAFEITMEPPKKSRPNSIITRSVASGNLKPRNTSVLQKEDSNTGTAVTQTAKSGSKNTVGSSTAKTTTTAAAKGPVSRFHRGDGVRSSFKSATQKVAASFRGRKANK